MRLFDPKPSSPDLANYCETVAVGWAEDLAIVPGMAQNDPDLYIAERQAIWGRMRDAAPADRRTFLELKYDQVEHLARLDEKLHQAESQRLTEELNDLAPSFMAGLESDCGFRSSGQ